MSVFMLTMRYIEKVRRLMSQTPDGSRDNYSPIYRVREAKTLDEGIRVDEVFLPNGDMVLRRADKPRK